jgi:hypothetical protein
LTWIQLGRGRRWKGVAEGEVLGDRDEHVPDAGGKVAVLEHFQDLP